MYQLSDKVFDEIAEEARENIICLFDGEPVCVELSSEKMCAFNEDYGTGDHTLTIWNDYTEENEEVKIHLHSYSGGVEVTAK